jgi:hypothetical protein
MPIRICTIIARNYLPAARVLASSFLEHNPSGHVAVLIIDDVRGDVDPEDEPFEVVRPEDLDLDAGEFHRMAMIYALVELATALKPWLLRHLLSRPDAKAVMYLDPDIRVYAPLDEVSALAEAEGIVLTPHVTSPIPRDGKMTDENTILSAGMYNLGFIAVGAQAQPFLDFWMARLARECRVDVSKNRFVDQRWIDFVPSVFGGRVLRDPSYNVAYWNLEHRDLRWTEGGYRVDGLPLHFFHFSGFDVTAPSLLSKWQGARPRVLLSERPDLARICGEYRVAIGAATRGGESGTRYGFADLPNGAPIDDESVCRQPRPRARRGPPTRSRTMGPRTCWSGRARRRERRGTAPLATSPCSSPAVPGCGTPSPPPTAPTTTPSSTGRSGRWRRGGSIAGSSRHRGSRLPRCRPGSAGPRPAASRPECRW